jgi:hypothetical protein
LARLLAFHHHKTRTKLATRFFAVVVVAARCQFSDNKKSPSLNCSTVDDYGMVPTRLGLLSRPIWLKWLQEKKI